MEKPKYARCIKQWQGGSKDSTKGKIYDTNMSPYFSRYSWTEIFNNEVNSDSNWEWYFVPATEEEWNKQEGIVSSYISNLLIMDRKQQLVEEACAKWEDGAKIPTLDGKYKGLRGEIYSSSDGHYRFCDSLSCSDAPNFYYDEMEDTLSNWGRGIGLIYRKGMWSDGTPSKLNVQTYEIY